MAKQIIAVDVDDVLAASASAFVSYSNEKYNLNLTIHDADEDWAKMWRVDIAEARLRAHDYHASGHMATYRRDEQAVRVLRRLSGTYSLIITTSRNKAVARLTEDWLTQHYPGIFTGVHFAGIYDINVPHLEALKMTKAQMLLDLKADYLIDDQPKHCIGAANCGKKAILFGDYPWHKTNVIPAGVVRCLDWRAVEEYFLGAEP